MRDHAEVPPLPPILAGKKSDQPSVFVPEGLLREARRQKGLPEMQAPPICVLDPDGDILRHLVSHGRGDKDESWACYHTNLHRFTHEGTEFGLVACAVGAPFAVLVAEELFTCGCELLVSITSAGQITALRPPPYLVLIERALRDEGTSYHYLPAADYSEADRGLLGPIEAALAEAPDVVVRGASWTTDAPFRETQAAIESATGRGILAVEMEAAALYAFARARTKPVVCFAHVTNQMARIEGDFEKGAADGTDAALRILAGTVRAWQKR